MHLVPYLPFSLIKSFVARNGYSSSSRVTVAVSVLVRVEVVAAEEMEPK